MFCLDVGVLEGESLSLLVGRSLVWLVISMEQARQVMQENGIGGKNTVEDVYVGLNAFWHDLSCDLEDSEVIKAAVAFWFKDADFPDKVGKVWWYMNEKMEVE